jgi:hypothetical protein
MSFPNIIPCLPGYGAAWYGSYEYRKGSVGSTHTSYQLFQGSVSVGSQHDIRVDNITYTWSDSGNAVPHGSIVSNGANIEVYMEVGDINLLYIFADPNSGTSTEGVVTIDDAVGNLSNNPSFSEMDVSISALSPGGSDYTYRLMKDNVLVQYWNNHVNGSVSNYTIDYSSLGQYGFWDLTVMQVSTITVKHLRRLTLVDPTVPVQNKKVHSNFW